MFLTEVTTYQQALDISVQKLFKDHLCPKIKNYIENKAKRD